MVSRSVEDIFTTVIFKNFTGVYRTGPDQLAYIYGQADQDRHCRLDV